MRHQPTIIALTGPNRVGKSTLANAIAEAAPTRVILESFAWPIHHTLGLMGFVRNEAAKDAPLPCLQSSYRDLAIALGEATREALGSDIYTRRIAERWDAMQRQDHKCLFVLDDLRKPDEAVMVHQRRGVVIELQREPAKYTGGLLDRRLSPLLIDASILALDPAETARHVLRMTGWLD